jgi:hypothetical protein
VRLITWGAWTLVRSETTTPSVRTTDELDLITSLPLGVAEAAHTNALANDEIGAVVAGSVIAFENDLTPTDKEWVESGFLLAQLAASAQGDRYRDPPAWYRKYFEVIEMVGWVVEEKRTSQRFRPAGADYSVFSVVEKAFDQTGSPETTEAVKSIFKALRNNLAASRGVSLFECASHGGGLGNFQVLTVRDDNGELSINLGRFRFNTPAHVVQLLNDKFPPSTDFEYGVSTFLLNRAQYARVSEAVKTKLGTRRMELTETIPALPGEENPP